MMMNILINLKVRFNIFISLIIKRKKSLILLEIKNRKKEKVINIKDLRNKMIKVIKILINILILSRVIVKKGLLGDSWDLKALMINKILILKSKRLQILK